MSMLWTLVAATVGTLGFSIIFGVKPKRLAFAVIGGMLCSCVYFGAKHLGAGEFMANAVATFLATIYSESMARVGHAPVVTFLTPAIVVLVPGGSLYYTMSYLLAGNSEMTSEYGMNSLIICLGIATGILAASIIFGSLTAKKRKRLAK